MKLMPNDSFWLDKLNIQYDQFEKEFAREQEHLIYRLAKKWDNRICEIIAKEINDAEFESDHREEYIKTLLETNLDESRQLIYLTDFARYKRYEAVLNVAQENLHPELLSTLELDHRKPNAKDILWLIFLLFFQEPESLFDVYLQDIEKKKSGGTWFQMGLNNNAPVPADLVNGLDRNTVNETLNRLFAPGAILCQSILDRDNDRVFFMWAEVTPGTLKLRNSRNQGYTEDWIIVRFDKRNRRVRIAAKSLDVGAKIFGDLVSDIANVKCELREEDEKTSAEKIKKFIADCLTGNEKVSDLIEIEFDNAPIAGIGTIIKLKNDFSIAKPLYELNEQYQWLDDMRRVQYIKIKYNEKPLKLAFDWLDDSPLSCIARWTDSRIDAFVQEEVTKYLKDNYDINVCSKRRQSRSNGIM